MRRNALDVDADTSDETSASHTAEDGFEFAEICLADELHADGTLASDHVWVIEGRDVGETVGFLQTGAFCLCSVEVGSVKDDITAHS